MRVLKLVLKNLLRHKLRSFLTILGLSCAVFAFGFLRTIVSAWNSGVASSSASRLITRDAVSFIYPLPLSYRDQIEKIPGVTKVSYAYWFQGVYKDQSFDNFFPRYAVDAEEFLSMYPEFIIPADELDTFKKERNACIVGKKIMDKYGWKLGDVIPIEGDIYPGHWQFVIRGVYTGKDKTVDETQMFLQWSYLNEQLKQTSPYRADQVGWYAIQVANANDAASISENVDALFANSSAKTKTETEKAFQQSFVSLSSAILTSLEVICTHHRHYSSCARQHDHHVRTRAYSGIRSVEDIGVQRWTYYRASCRRIVGYFHDWRLCRSCADVSDGGCCRRGFSNNVSDLQC